MSLTSVNAYIRTWQGWLYLAVVMDLFARKVVGWSMKPMLAKELVFEVFYNRIRRHSYLGGISPEVFEQTSF